MGRRGLGGCGLKRGEIRWYTFRLPDKRRPVLILTRNDVIDQLNEIIVVPATRTIRGLTSQVVLTVDDGMPVVCALNFDHMSLAQRSRIGPVLCVLLETRWLKCGTRYSSRAVSEDQAIEAAKQARPRVIRSELPRAPSPGYLHNGAVRGGCRSVVRARSWDWVRFAFFLFLATGADARSRRGGASR